MSNKSFYLGMVVFLLLLNIAGYKIIGPLMSKGMNALYQKFPQQAVLLRAMIGVSAVLLFGYVIYDLFTSWDW